MAKDWEVVHYGPVDWEGGGPSEKKHYSRHATEADARRHARKIAHANLQRGTRVEYTHDDDEYGGVHTFLHKHPDGRSGDAVHVQKVGAQEAWEKADANEPVSDELRSAASSLLKAYDAKKKLS